MAAPGSAYTVCSRHLVYTHSQRQQQRRPRRNNVDGLTLTDHLGSVKSPSMYSSGGPGPLLAAAEQDDDEDGGDDCEERVVYAAAPVARDGGAGPADLLHHASAPEERAARKPCMH